MRSLLVVTIFLFSTLASNSTATATDEPGEVRSRHIDHRRQELVAKNSLSKDYAEFQKEVVDIFDFTNEHRNGVAICFAVVVFLSCALEMLLKHVLKVARTESLRAIGEVMLKELVLLGILSFFLFLASELKSLEPFSIAMFGSATELNHLLHQVHMLLFLLMVAYVLLVILVLQFVIGRSRLWHGCEVLVKENFKSETDLKTASSPEGVPLTEYKLIRTQFVRSMAKLGIHLPSDFDFAEYLSLCQGECFSAVIDVRPLSWVVVFCFVPVVWVYIALQTSWLRVMVFAVVPCSAFISIAVVRRTLLSIRFQLTGIRAKSPFRQSKNHTEAVGIIRLPSDDKLAGAGAGAGPDRTVPPYELGTLMTDRSGIFFVEKFRRIFRWRGKGKDTPKRRYANAHQMLFPFSQKGPSFLRHVIRVVLVLISIVVAILIYDVVLDFSTISNPVSISTGKVTFISTFSPTGKLPLIVEVCLAIPCVAFVVWIVADSVRLLTICTSIEMMANHEVLRTCIENKRHERRAGAFAVNATLRALLRRLLLQRKIFPLAGAGGVSRRVDDVVTAARVVTLFDDLDVEKTGTLGVSEVKVLLATIGISKMKESSMCNVMLSIDLTDSGRVSADDLIAFVKEIQNAESLLHPENALDADAALALFTHLSAGQPLIQIDAFSAAVSRLNPHLSDKDVRAWYVTGESEDGCLSLSQFKRRLHRASL